MEVKLYNQIWLCQIKENTSLQIRVVAENGLKVLSPLIDLLLLVPCHSPPGCTSDPLA